MKASLPSRTRTRRRTDRRAPVVAADLALLAESDLVGLVLVRSRHIVWSNEAFAAMHGYRARDVVGKSTRMFFPSDAAYEEFGREARTVLAAGKVFRATVQHVRKDGTAGWYSLNIRRRSPRGENDEQIGVVLDVTGLKAATAWAENAAFKLELALAGAELGTWATDIASRVSQFDERYCGMLGYRQDEIAPTMDAWLRLIHPEDKAAVDAAVEAHLSGAVRLFEVEHRMRHKDGHWVWVLARGKIFRDAQGNPVRAAGTHLDITDRKRLHAESGELLRQIGQLIANLAHPFSGPADGQATAGKPPAQLSRRHTEVLQLVASGATAAEIARRLGISEGTAKTHRRNLMRKLDLHTKADLVRYALSHRIVA